MTNKDAVLAILDAIRDLKIAEDALDEEVRKCHAAMAVGTNNGGFEAQVEFLLTRMPDQEILDLVRSHAPGGPNES